jgi:RHS repeat-associated protein
MAKSTVMVAAGKAPSFSRPARRVTPRPAEPIPVCIQPPMPFVEGPGPGKAWWEKALSEKTFSGPKRGNKQQNQGVGAKSRTTNLGPFGELVRQTGPMATANPFRFSTKYDDDESDLLYYGYRYYKPTTGTWPNRDPIHESGFLNLYSDNIRRDLYQGTALRPDGLMYGFVKNNPIGYVDKKGLVVKLETHEVAFGFQHSYLALIVDCGSKFYNGPFFKNLTQPIGGFHYATLGAGPEGNGFGYLYLTSGINRPKDVARAGVEYSVDLDDPLANDDPLIEKLFSAFAHFPNRTFEYVLFPDDVPGDVYNSNSFTHGLLSAVGIDAAQPPSTPGWDKPVPIGDFQ